MGGRKGLIDAKPFLEHFLFEPLKEKTLFDQVEVDRLGGVKWPNGGDICIDWIGEEMARGFKAQTRATLFQP